MNADESSIVCQKVSTLNLNLTHVTDSSYNPPDIWLVTGIYSSSAKWIGQVTSPDEYFEINVKSDESQPGKCQRVVS